MANSSDIRNVVLLGHAGSGKTTLAESILHKAGAVNRLGSVDEKTSICDYFEEEKERQQSIQSALAHANHAGKLINVIDTPGPCDKLYTCGRHSNSRCKCLGGDRDQHA